MSIFRREALEHARQRLAGDVIVATPLSAKTLGMTCTAILLVGLIFASTTSYSRRETAMGWVAPEAGLVRVAARQPGIVRTIGVVEGQRVLAGQTLAAVKLSSDTALGDSGALMAQSLGAEATASREAAAATQDQARAALAEQAASLLALQGELDEAKARVETLDDRRKLVRRQATRAETLRANGFISQATLEASQSTALDADREASEARSAALSLQRQLNDQRLKRASLEAQLRAATAARAMDAESYRRKRNELQNQSDIVLSAPLAGRVVAIPVNAGQYVTPESTVLVLTPNDSRLIAELYVPSRAAGFIEPGQEVRLMYEAFPYQKFGTGKGRVQSVSRTLLSPTEIPMPAHTIKEPVFRVRVLLDKDFVEAYGKAIHLQPGMMLSADVIFDRRSLAQWILDPLYAVGMRK